VLIPAFSIGRTQELLYELEEIIHRAPAAPRRRRRALGRPRHHRRLAAGGRLHRRLRSCAHWDAEARASCAAGRHPLAFEQLTTIDSHAAHLRSVAYLARSARPAIVIAASGMCSGGRIVNYLKAMLGDPRHDVLFVGYQAAGTPGRDIQTYGPRGGYVVLDGQRIDIRAGIHTLGGYSAHADQKTCSTSSAACAPSRARCGWCTATTGPSARWPGCCGSGIRAWRWWCPETGREIGRH
jgi:metallo-beta-lactamase family protein